jgi:peptidoglycan LD-endopeptidase LytH
MDKGRTAILATAAAGYLMAAAVWSSLDHSSPVRQAQPSRAVEVKQPIASGLLRVPVEGVAAHELTRQFEARRSGGRQHRAIDILAPRGTPVLAADDGRIARLMTNELGGLTIYQFDRRGERTFYYAHLERYASGLAENELVRRGQVIGYVGTSGNAPEDAPHLHFAVMSRGPGDRWWAGTPIDPFDLLVATRTAAVAEGPPRR